MDNKQIVVDPAELRKAATTLGGIATEMEAITKRMHNLINRIREVWQDENGKALADTYEGDVQAKIDDYYNTVAAYSNYFKKANELYTASDAAIASSIKTPNYNA